MSGLSGVWIGDAERDEFRPIRNWLDEHTVDVNCEMVPTVRAFTASKSRADLVIIGESWPDEFNAEDVSRLIAVVPLARMVCLTGAWSEAIGRTRSHWPPVWRTPLWDAISRLERELSGLRACQSDTYTPMVPFPAWTANRQETWIWQNSTPIPPATSGEAKTVCLDEIADSALAAWYSELLHSAGHRVSGKNAQIVLLDVDPWSSIIYDHCRVSIARQPGALPIALTAWNTPSLQTDLATLGITHIADKLAPESLLRVLSDIPKPPL